MGWEVLKKEREVGNEQRGWGICRVRIAGVCPD